MKAMQVCLAAVMLAASVGLALAGPTVFDFKDPKGVNAIAISLDSLTEPIVGLATGVTGTVTFDPEKPEATTGELAVGAASIQMCHPVMTKVLHSADWLDVASHPTVTFAIRKVETAKKAADATWELAVTGDMTIKGVTREQRVTLKATHLPGQYEARNHEGKGDLLILRGAFSVDRRSFNIKPDLPPVSVGYDILLNVGIVGGHLVD